MHHSPAMSRKTQRFDAKRSPSKYRVTQKRYLVMFNSSLMTGSEAQKKKKKKTRKENVEYKEENNGEDADRRDVFRSQECRATSSPLIFLHTTGSPSLPALPHLQ